MCAINPTHKKRFVFDVYTSQHVSKEFFEQCCMETLLEAEVKLNTEQPMLRFHLKESTQEAD